MPIIDVTIYPTAQLLATEAAGFVSRTLRDLNRPASLGLAGGATPRATYRALRGEHAPWDQVDIWLGDERWVPSHHEDSNAGMARSELVDHIPSRLHAPDWHVGDPHDAAAAYELRLETFMPMVDGRPQADVVILGLGDDGHTASLFPGTDALAEMERSYVATWVESKMAWRLTATLPMLWAARDLVFIVSGEAKADAVHRILDQEADLPAGRVIDGAARAHWFLDEPAASRLTNTPR